MKEDQATAAFVVDDSDFITEANSSAANLAGLPSEALVGRPIDDVVFGLPMGADGREARRRSIARVYVAASVAQAWCCRLAPNRTAILLFAAPGESGAQDTLALVMAGVEHAPDGFEITDEDGCAEYANPAALLLLERPHVDVLGAPVWRYLDGAEAPLVEAAVRDGVAWRGEAKVHVPSGALRVHDIVLTPVRDRDSLRRRFVVLRRDVTERIAAAREVEALRESLVAADRHGLVGQIASMLAHEMNNPATFIVSNLRLALDDLEALLEGGELNGAATERLAQVREMLRDATRGSERVVNLVRRLLAASALPVGDCEYVALADAARDALRLTRSKLGQRARVVEDLTEPAVVIGDRTRLGQVLVNVLAHALETIPDGDPHDHEIAIGTRTEGEFGEVTVRDSGRWAVSPPAADVLVRWLDTHTIDETSVGVAIARDVLRGLGGTLTMDRFEAKGGVTTVRLPRSPRGS